MVQRVEATGKLDEFEAIVETVELESGIQDRKQYHITMKPTSIEIKGATGFLHEWLPVSPRATEEAVPQGSVMDRYLTQVEICVKGAKTCKTIKEELGLMVGKKFRFKKLKLGKDYNGQPAREYSVPVAAL
jgi:hypothetical protein